MRGRYRATLLAVLAGDASGAPYETQRSGTICIDIAKRGGLQLYDYIEPFKHIRPIPAGHPTDDAELTAALARSLVRSRGFDPGDVYRELRGFIFGNDGESRKSVLTSGQAYGSGGTLRSALRAATYQESLVEFREGRVRVIPSNGALMRSSGVALVSRREEDVIRIAQKQSCVTHVHPDSQVACIAYSLMLRLLLDGDSPSQAWERTRIRLGELLYAENTSKDKVLRQAYNTVLRLDMTIPPSEEEIWPHSGEVMLSLRIAVWATLSSTSIVDGLEKCILLGGDTDTYAAIAGGLLGAHYGVNNLPEKWRNTLIGREIMIDLADQLHAIAYSSC